MSDKTTETFKMKNRRLWKMKDAAIFAATFQVGPTEFEIKKLSSVF